MFATYAPSDVLTFPVNVYTGWGNGSVTVSASAVAGKAAAIAVAAASARRRCTAPSVAAGATVRNGHFGPTCLLLGWSGPGTDGGKCGSIGRGDDQVVDDDGAVGQHDDGVEVELGQP